MIEPKLQIVLKRRDCARNIARFYVLAIEPSLYGDAVLVRAWGRIGSLGRQRLDLYASADEAGEALEAWLARKIRRGYAPIVSKVKIPDGAPVVTTNAHGQQTRAGASHHRPSQQPTAGRSNDASPPPRPFRRDGD